MFWDVKTGFDSEDSENQHTKFDTFNRRYKKERLQEYSAPFLQRREIQPFEKILIKICENVLKELMGKQLN